MKAEEDDDGEVDDDIPYLTLDVYTFLKTEKMAGMDCCSMPSILGFILYPLRTPSFISHYGPSRIHFHYVFGFIAMFYTLALPITFRGQSGE